MEIESLGRVEIANNTHFELHLGYSAMHIPRTQVGITTGEWLPSPGLGKKNLKKTWRCILLPNLRLGSHALLAIPTWVLGICFRDEIRIFQNALAVEIS